MKEFKKGVTEAEKADAAAAATATKRDDVRKDDEKKA